MRETKIAFGEIARIMGCHMHGHARMPYKERKENHQTNTM